jgi:streptogramin lyase
MLGVLAVGCGVALADQGTQAFSPESLQAFPTPNATAYITALAPDAEGNMWFTETVPYSGSGAGTPSTLDRIDSSGLLTGEFAVPFVVPSGPPEARSEPNALAVDASGDMWFTDGSDNAEGVYMVGYVTPAGTFNEFDVPTHWSGPADMALGADGAMWFTEEGRGQIGRATKHGVKEFSISPEAYPVIVEYHEPAAIALGPDGNMWFTDRAPNAKGEDAIGRITPGGEVTEFPISGPYGAPSAIALGADGNMWFTQSPDVIGRITPEGTISEFAAAGVSNSLEGIALGSDGNMWFTEGNDQLGRITPAGDVTGFSTAAVGDRSSHAIARGLEGYLWYVEGSNIETENRVVRVALPFAPVDEGQPTISGQAVEGQVLSAMNGRWAHAPSTFAYQWQICDANGANCTGLAGQTEVTHLLAAGDVGHTLRLVVTAGNIGGTTSATSAASAVVQAAPRAPAQILPGGPILNEPLPVVASPMTWNFGWARTYTVVDSLVVHGVPVAGLVEVTCHGGGCAFARWRSNAVAPRSACKHRRCGKVGPRLTRGEVDLAGLFEDRHLKVGARVIVTISKPGWIGKSFVFTVRADKPPRVQITCLGSGPSNPTGGC